MGDPRKARRQKVYAIPQDDDYFYFEDGSVDEDRMIWALRALLVIVLIGENNLDHPWLEWEGEFCHQWGIRRVLLRIPYTTGPIPDEFKFLREIAYNPNAIEKELKDRENPGGY